MVRTLVLLLAFQLSGAGHTLADARLFGTEDGSDPHGDCSSEEPGRDCPPGCPTCHHAGGGVGSLPQQTACDVMPAAPQVARFAPMEADAPSTPELPSLFRPPKLA